MSSMSSRGGARRTAGQRPRSKKARTALKSSLATLCYYGGIDRMLALRYAGLGTIFSLHSVVAGGSDSHDKHLRCPIARLESTLRWLTEHEIQILSIDEAFVRLADRSSEKFCVFTFDDGYVDNLIHALPVMERFNAPFTVYVTSGMITGEVDAWWLGLAALVNSQASIELPEPIGRFECDDHGSKSQAFSAIADVTHSNPAALATLKRVIAEAGIDSAALARTEGLTAQQLRRLAASPLVTIGAHGVRHIDLTRAAPTEAEFEMAQSRRLLEEIIDRKVIHFSYPFGRCSRRETEIARSCGYATAVTTQRGTLFKEHLSHRFALPREPIVHNETPRSLRFKLNGMYRAFNSRMGDPIAPLEH